MKTLQISERINANLKLESFNAFNRANFNAPITNMDNNNFGKVTSADAGRTSQVSLLLRF